MLADLINFDTKTLLGVLIWGNAAAGIIIYLYHTLNVSDTDRNNIRNMTIIRILCAAGYLLLFLRGSVNDIISVNIGNTILFFSHYLEARLILELANSSGKKLNNIITVILIISLLAFNTIELFYRDTALRIGMASVIIFSIFLLPTVRIITSAQVSKFKKSISIFYIFLLVALIPRMMQYFFDKNVTLLSNHYSQTLMFIAFILMTLSNTIIYLLFIKEKTDIVIEKNSALITLLNALDTYMFVAELDTDIVIFANDKMKEKFNFGDDAIGKLCYEVMNPGKNKRCDFCIKSKLLKNPELAEAMDTQVEIHGINYKKADRIIEWHDGRKVHLQYYIDVSELKQAEFKLKSQMLDFIEAKNKAERIINTAPIAYGLSVGGIILEVNEYAKKHLGMKPGDETISFYANPEERKALDMNKQTESGESLISGILRFHMPDGGSHRFLTNYSLLSLDRKDRTDRQEAVILWAVDVEFSELQKDQLRLSQESLQTLLDMMPVTVRVLDIEDETLIYANQAAFKMYEVESPEAVYGKRVDALMPETQPDGTSSVEQLHELNMSLKPVSKEMVFRRANGEDFEALISVFSIDYKGRRASVGLIQDLSAEKAYENMLRNTAEKEKEANRSKSEFLSRMSHEIRTPMNAIIGMTAIARNSGEQKKIRQCLDQIENASKHLLGVINDILDMSKIEADKLELFYEEFDFNNMLENITGIINFNIERKQQILKVNIDKDVPTHIIGDEQRLSQVVTNLLSNATKFTPDCGIIEMNAKKTGEHDGICTIQIEVEDSGIGIPPEQQSNIFNSFEQASGSISRKYGGTGLGLSISRRIVEMMGGNIWVESESGRGSKFIFTIKAGKGTGKFAAAGKAEVLPENKDFSDYTVLMAEDIEINRDIISAFLEDTGIVIDMAANGLEAVNYFRNNPGRYNLILMDINMPEMDGYDAAKSIRTFENKNININKNAKTVPIIAMTADVFKEDIERCLAAGMNDHIGKPVDIDELFMKLNKYLI